MLKIDSRRRSNELEKGDRELEPKEIKRLLRQNRLALLLDGINEIPSEDLRRWLQEFRDDNLTTPMIFTTRDLAVGCDLGIKKRLKMCPLTEPQMREFVQKYLPEHGVILLRQLNDRLREVAETPLLLKLLCDVFDPNTQQIPQSKGELFQRFDRDYQHIKRDIQAVPVSENFWEFKSEVLQHLAFIMIQADAQKPTEAWLTLPKDQAEHILEKWLTERGLIDAPTKAKLWLKDLLNHHLLQVAADPEKIEFHHQLFQEYYAAEALLVMLRDEHSDVKDDRLQYFYLNYLKWTEAIAIALSLMENETQISRLVQLALNVDWKLGARLAGVVKPRFQQQTVSMVSALNVPEWLKVQLLGETLSKSAAPELLKLLESEDIRIYKDVILSVIRIDKQLVASKVVPAISKIIACTETEYFDEDFHSWASGILSVAIRLGIPIEEHEVSGLLKTLSSKPIYVEILGAVLTDDLEIPPQQQWCNKPTSELIQSLKSKKKVVRDAAAYQLGRRGSCECLINLRELQSEIKTSWEYCSTISKIQVKCQFYNYEIAQWKLAPHSAQRSPSDQLADIYNNTQDINQRTKQMADQPKNDFSGATFQAPVNFGDNNQGGFINTQNNYAIPQETEAAQQLKVLLEKLRQKHPNATNEQLFDMFCKGFEMMPQRNPENWRNWQNILSLLFAGGIEGIKIWQPLVGIPIAVLTRLCEIYQRHPKQLSSS